MVAPAKKKSTKIPDKIAAEVMFKSNLQCCVCPEKGDHIHHLNGDNTDHRIDNLAYLCYPHHNEATITGGLSRKLSKETIIKFREQHYKEIKNRRDKALEENDHSINQLTEEKLLIASRNALIIIELEKIKEEYFSSDWASRIDIFHKISRFRDHSNNRVANDIFNFLSLVAGQTRGGMPYDLALSVSMYIIEFFPSLYEASSREESIRLAERCINIGYNIAYDALIHLDNLAVAMPGLSIIKYVYRSAKEAKCDDLKAEVKRTYVRLESTLRRPERTDLGKAQELAKIFREDLEEWDLSYPILTDHLIEQVELDEKRTKGK